MSFVFRGMRADLESGLPGFIPEWRSAVRHRFHGTGRVPNANPMTLFIYVVLLIMMLSSYTSENALLWWFGMGVFLMLSGYRLYSSCKIQGQAAALARTQLLLRQAQLAVPLPSPLSISTRARLQGMRLQLALLDREFDDLDYDALRALDADNPPGVTAMSDTDISTLPVRMYKGSLHKSHTESLPSGSEVLSGEVKVDVVDSTSEECLLDKEAGKQNNMVYAEEELTCSVCLEQVVDGELVRILPCLHQFHSACIDQWLRQQGICPVCKFKLSGPDTLSTGTRSSGSSTAAITFRM